MLNFTTTYIEKVYQSFPGSVINHFQALLSTYSKTKVRLDVHIFNPLLWLSILRSGCIESNSTGMKIQPLCSFEKYCYFILSYLKSQNPMYPLITKETLNL